MATKYMLLNTKSNYPIGLDISDLTLKFVQLNKISDKIFIQSLGKINIPPNIFKNGEIINKEQAIKEIKRLLNSPKYGKVTSNEVVACLPEQKTFIKLVEIDQIENKDLQSAIIQEIEKNVPMSIDEIYYDWQIIKSGNEKTQVLIGVAPRNIINQYTNLFDEAKLSIAALEIEPISICRCLLAEENIKYKGRYDKNYGIIDVGARRSNFTIYSKNTIIFSFSLPISGQEITEKIAQALKIDHEKAEKAKIICGLDKEKAKGIISDLLNSMIKNLISKINDSIMYFKQHFPGYGDINKIILCGGGANIKNLDKIINEYIFYPVELGNPFINLSDDQQKLSKFLLETHEINESIFNKNKNTTNKFKQNTSLTYVTSIGLALRDIFINKL